MTIVQSASPRTARTRGFTLIELLIVILIIGLIGVATLPLALATWQQNTINLAARQLHAELSRARDTAVRNNKPAGIRLIPDRSRPGVLTSSRMIAIEQGPDYSEGKVHYFFEGPYQPPVPPLPDASLGPDNYPYLVIHEEKFDDENPLPGGVLLPNPPTSWYYNIRQGDKIRLNDSGRIYTIAGPIVNPGIAVPPGSSIADPNAPEAVKNPERLINFGPHWVSTPGSYAAFEFLFLLNGIDDDGDGFIDEAFDGINNDGDFYPAFHPLAGLPCIDPGFNGIDDNLNGQIDEALELFWHWNSDGTASALPNSYANEFEQERPVGSSTISLFDESVTYTIIRRPVPSPGARELELPRNIFIDMTTWDAVFPFFAERSRLPVDPYTGFVDILVAPNGSVIQQSYNANPAPGANMPYYHFWLTDIDGVQEPFPPATIQQFGINFRLPMPAGTLGDPSLPNPDQYPYPPGLTTLRGNRRLISLNTRTGHVVTTSLERFATNNPNEPFEAAQAGAQEEP